MLDDGVAQRRGAHRGRITVGVGRLGQRPPGQLRCGIHRGADREVADPVGVGLGGRPGTRDGVPREVGQEVGHPAAARRCLRRRRARGARSGGHHSSVLRLGAHAGARR
ncbi:hypothetical protein SDC9_74224 [bioreactor metagenome]|uniref:Uncharacterized protein n=1 Tax=bioreactor metagenome TaxID=1076179 RepID=A0A644YIJ7_9ZZZZ